MQRSVITDFTHRRHVMIQIFVALKSRSKDLAARDRVTFSNEVADIVFEHYYRRDPYRWCLAVQGLS